MSEIKVGDKIKVTKLLFLDRANGIVKGETYEVIELDSEGFGVFVNTPIQNNCSLIYEQIEKVEEEEQVSEFKVGDKVRVKWVDEQDVCLGVSKGDCFDVLRVDSDGDVLFDLLNGEIGVLYKQQVELVEDKTEFTFPEMAQKLIDGEFEIGTELIADGGSYFVDRVGYTRNYGLKTNKEGCSVISNIGASDFNATWKVKEQPIKEMSIEDIQKELGYKIKVTE